MGAGAPSGLARRSAALSWALILLVLPQMYGVGYPVMNKVFAGHYVLWFIVILMVGKIVAASVTLSIGGSGGVFAPSLFMGAAAGTAFGLVAQHLFGPADRPSGAVRGGGDGRRVRRRRPGAADGDRQRGRDDRQLTGSPCRSCSPPGSPPRCPGASPTAASTRQSCSAGASTSSGHDANMLQTLTVGDVMEPIARTNGRASLDTPERQADVSERSLAPASTEDEQQ